jgi:hypothetical protein
MVASGVLNPLRPKRAHHLASGGPPANARAVMRPALTGTAQRDGFLKDLARILLLRPLHRGDRDRLGRSILFPKGKHVDFGRDH